MRIPWELVLSFAAGLTLICLTGYLLIAPPKLLWRLLAGGILGAMALMLVNLAGAAFGVRVAVNPVTALAVGFLGLPGAALVIALNLLL